MKVTFVEFKIVKVDDIIRRSTLHETETVSTETANAPQSQVCHTLITRTMNMINFSLNSLML